MIAEQTREIGAIAQMNDVFRKSGFGVTITRGIRELHDVLQLLEAVRGFDEFTADNDPYKKHDFGTIKWGCEKVFWKIDYYDQKLEYGEDPLSPQCRRVLTVMLAEEY